MISCARKYAESWTFPAGSSDNKLYFEKHVTFDERIDEENRMLLFDAQTSGGLLLAVPPKNVEAMLQRAEAIHQPLWVMGEVTEGNYIEIV